MNTGQQEQPPEEFVAQVKQVLEHLYKLPYLHTHPLVQALSLVPQAGESAGQRLRAEVMAAMESLCPAEDLAFRSPHARLYNLLHLHYVEGLTMQEVSRELALSLRQTFRDLRSAEESVATLLWAQRRNAAPPEPRAVQLSSVQEEVALLKANSRPADLRPLLVRAEYAVERLAQQRDVRIETQLPAGAITVFAVPAIAQQVLTSTLSQIVQMARPRTAVAVAWKGEQNASVEITFDQEGASPFLVNEVLGRLLDQLGWRLVSAQEPGARRTVTVTMVPPGPTILVIDDNAGLVELLQRYLSGHACRVVPTTDAQDGLLLARNLHPDVIVLDVMMPEIDGWQVLQTLRALPETSAVPVIICSVLNDPQLAYSLGASLFVAKPVSRSDILAALHRLGVAQ